MKRKAGNTPPFSQVPIGLRPPLWNRRWERT